MEKRPRISRQAQIRASENRRQRAALHVARREIAELRRTVAQHEKQLEALMARLDLIASREQELRAMLLSSHDQLMRRADAIKAELAAEIQPPAPRQHAREPHPAPELPAEIRPAEPGLAASEQAGYERLSKHLGYRRLIARIRDVVGTVLPLEATVAVVSKGDEELLDLGGRREGWHFPQDEEGVYAGYYPADSTGAIFHLEELRKKGAEFLLFPGTALWWLERYGEFREHLDGYYRRVWGDEVCVIYALSEKLPSGGVGER